VAKKEYATYQIREKENFIKELNDDSEKFKKKKELALK
jgi:hypothetical protein